MNDLDPRIIYLFEKYLSDELSVQENLELETWKNQSDNHKEIFEKLTDNDYLIEAVGRHHKYESNEAARYKRIWDIIAAEENITPRKFPLKRLTWYKIISAAAAIVIIAGIGYIRTNNNKSHSVTQTEQPVIVQGKASGKESAILKLANGQEIILDNAANGNLAQQGNTQVIKTGEGAIKYNAKSTGRDIYYNTVTIPRGSQYQLVLPDGSKVWMNAASSLHFPTAFAGKERSVELTGEAYFEVAKNAGKPFVVQLSNGASVKVLGTHFNIMAYGEEKEIKTTLVEGTVQVSTKSAKALLQPGQQALMANNMGADAKITINKKADVDKAVAWKSGLFIFRNDELENVMLELERWYNVKVVYKDQVPSNKFDGIINRDMPLSDVLKALELNNVHFTVDGEKIIVTK